MQKVDYYNKEKRGPKARRSVPLKGPSADIERSEIVSRRGMKNLECYFPIRAFHPQPFGLAPSKGHCLAPSALFILYSKNTGIFLIYIIALLLGTLSSCRTTKPPTTSPAASLQHHTFAQLDSLMAIEQRPVAVFLHADWCRFCKNMEQTTFKNKDVIDLLNNKFYFVSFNGEQKERVYFNQQIFDYEPTGRDTGTHDLAKALGTIDEILTYPGFVILNPKYEITFQHNAYLSAQDLRVILGTVGE